MIESILRTIYPQGLRMPYTAVSVPMKRENTSFAIGDSKSCKECHALPSRVNRMDCNEEVLKIDNNGIEIAVVHLEEYMAQFGKAGVGECCDYLLTDSGMAHNKIVFCELCCYDEKYITKKRAKARQQMGNALEVLIKELDTAVLLLTYPHKVHLFAWRDYNVPDKPVVPVRGNVRANMQVFGSVVSNMATQTTSHHVVMNHAFTFMQVKYPSVYSW